MNESQDKPTNEPEPPMGRLRWLSRVWRCFIWGHRMIERGPGINMIALRIDLHPPAVKQRTILNYEPCERCGAIFLSGCTGIGG